MNYQEAITSYDKVPYPHVSHSMSHPDRLATVAALLGMQPAPLERCRVLELGCAGGANLIPMAYTLPGSHFVGIDNSSAHIAEGQAMVTALDLPNINLKQMSIADVTETIGQFDYIIAHGVYSWVPPAIQDKLLTICRQNLAPNGVAYISYNTYPGWNMLGTLRDILLYHTRHITDPLAQATEARTFLEFLTRSIDTGPNTHGSFLYVYINYIKEFFLPKEDAFLLHDELAEINQPVYFHQFAEQAAAHELKYLGDVHFSSMLIHGFPAEVTEELRRMVKSTVELEQYLDFLRNRTFRQSLLCHQEVRLKTRLSPERLAQFYVASSAIPASSPPEIHQVSIEQFQALNGANFTTDHPLTKAALLHLTQIWPQSLAFAELVMAAYTRLGREFKPAEQESWLLNPDIQLLGANLLQAYSYSDTLVELHVHKPQFVTQLSERPVASPVARFQAKHGYKITNLRHERITLDKLGTSLLAYLEGTHDQAALLALMQEKDMVEIERQDGQAVKAGEIPAILANLLQQKLEQFAHAALLIA
jgi:methyltransferase-like protein/2-polyprenyl-3-methyl-5-hydroxy-6-metoxy-1,4-benzoquinol methylase